MKISQNNITDLNAIITIELESADYQDSVNSVLKDYARTAQVPGFRKGHVPVGMVKKMYGKGVLVEQLDKIINQAMQNYILEKDLQVLGTPMAVRSDREQNFEEGKSFTFDFEVGLAPDFTLQLPSTKLPYYLARIDEKMVEDDIADIRRRYGKFSNPESSEPDTIFYGEFSELNDSGEKKEEGHKNTGTLSVEMIKETERKRFLGLKKGDSVEVKPRDIFHTESEMAAILKLDKSDPAINSNYRFEISTVNRVEKAELNQELFDKLFGEGVVQSEDEFRTKVREGIASYFEQGSNDKLKKDLKLALLDENSMELPDEFLRKLVKSNQTKEMDEATFDHEYYHVKEELKWDLIQSKFLASHKLEILPEEIREMAKSFIRQQFSQYGMPAPEDKMEEMVESHLGDEKNYRRIYGMIRENKVFELMKKEIRLDMTELPLEEFSAKLKEKTAHETEHHH